MAMDDALTNILEKGGNAVTANARQVMLRSADAREGVLRTLALLAPHIAEKNEAKMDELDAKLAGQDQDVRGDLKALASLLGRRNRDLETATAPWMIWNGPSRPRRPIRRPRMRGSRSAVSCAGANPGRLRCR